MDGRIAPPDTAKTRIKRVRDFVAGTGAGGSLAAAALVAFLSVTALVAFDEMPFGGEDDDAGTVSLQGSGLTALSGGFDGAGPIGAVVLGAEAAAPGGGPGPGPGGGAPAGGGDPPVPGAPGAVPPPGSPNPIDQAAAGVDATVEGGMGVNSDRRRQPPEPGD